jgi:subtilisin family serine protease
MTTTDSAPTAGPASKPRQRPGAAIAVFLALWIAIVVAPFVFVLWIGEQLDLATGGDAWQGGWIAGQLYLAAVIGLPAWLAGRLSVIPRYRAAFGVWLLAAVFALCLLPARLAGPTEAQTAAALQIGGLLLYLLLLAALRRGGGRLARPGGLAAAVAGAALLALPWVAWGALGSALDTALNLLAALLFGLAAALTLEHKLLPILREEDAIGRGHRLLLGGLVAAALLLVMGGTFGVNGQQLILVILLPGLGWAVARLGLARGGWAAVTLLVGLAVAAPLLLVDPDELNLMLNLGSRDVGYYVTLATLLGALLGGLLSLAALARPRATGRRATALLALAAVVALVAAYFLVGQVGWHGERLYVVLKDQADVAAAVVIDDPVERRTVVYGLLTQHADSTQIDLRRALDRWGVDYTPYYLVNALEVDGGPLWRWWLERRLEVERVLVSPELRPLPAAAPAAVGTAAAPTMPLWSQRLIYVPRVHDELGITGAGIVVGQSDSGVVGTHVELRHQYRGNAPGGPAGDDYNWLDPWQGTSAPTDSGGHGTHTLGTAVGRNVGVAPGATWIACVNLPRNLGNPPRYLDCLQFLLAPFPQAGDALTDGRPDLGAHVLNNSWGCPPQEGCDAEALRPAFAALRAAGVFVVASAGNNGPSCESIDSPPAHYDEVFTVGATGEAGIVADFSSRGPVTADGSGRTKPDIVAPGAGILSAYPRGYEYNDGTSMAGPHVVGVVALMWSANPALIGNIDRTEQILIETARDDYQITDSPRCGDPNARPNNTTGYGLVDALAAVEMALAEP